MSQISPLAYVHPTAKIGEGTIVHPFVYIDKNVTVGENNVIMPHASLMEGTMIGAGNTIHQNAVIGAIPQSFKYKAGEHTHVHIGDNNHIRENVVIAGGFTKETATVIGSGNFLMDAVHICHDVEIKDNCVLGIGSQISGECSIDSNVIISSAVIVQHQSRIGTYSLLQSASCIHKDIPPYAVIGGNPATYHGISATILKENGLSEKVLRHIANAYRIVFAGNESLEDSVLKIKDQIPGSEEIDIIVSFLENTKRGIVGTK